MILTPTSFATIVAFVLREGDRMTYCNMYNDNPHVAHDDFDVFLNPDVGQRNINCDPELSGFDEIVFRDAGAYSSVKLVDEQLEFDATDRPALEFYFATLVAHISAQTGPS